VIAPFSSSPFLVFFAAPRGTISADEIVERSLYAMVDERADPGRRHRPLAGGTAQQASDIFVDDPHGQNYFMLEIVSGWRHAPGIN
jgi:hypothetical protein